MLEGLDPMIVCHCTGVTDKAVTQLIQDGATTVTEITRRCGAGRCCIPCREELAAILARARGAAADARGPHASPDAPSVLIDGVAV